MSELTPFDMGYYARPRSEKDKKTLAEEGWRELTKEEVNEFVECSKRSGRDEFIKYVNLVDGLESGRFSLRYYEKEASVCVYFNESKNYFPLIEGDDIGNTVSLKKLMRIPQKDKHEPFEGFKADKR